MNFPVSIHNTIVGRVWEKIQGHCSPCKSATILVNTSGDGDGLSAQGSETHT